MIEPADGGQERVGSHQAVALRADQARFGGDKILLRVEDFERGALSGLRLAANPFERIVAARTSSSDAVTAISALSCVTQAATTAAAVWVRTRSSTMRVCASTSLPCRTCAAARPPS